MITYSRITFKPGVAARKRSIFLMNPVEGAKGEILIGIEVDREGCEIHGKDFDERKHIISTELISKRVEYVMNNHYGQLEPRS